ncbi:carboxypeptidase-like regulatory domain-containing protein [Olivibacter domesticus]|uniref:CarboxypepD_reg-like domain-containing protein n=1 Tax=Olivibacter domesticus TaxID=407022 RepID=A0A1H7QFK3_OLID1|nr:carboxypeptidase-like regulatory domain-containing protein [Olivibacter domesticus]SEL46772.1 CarboxypepD_reg-like domain-containing protein [Olivibacter domesticus]
MKGKFVFGLYIIAFFLSFSSCFFTVVLAQEVIHISGKVTTTNGETAPGVSVRVKGKRQGTTTDVNGLFQVQATSSDILIFSQIGMASQEVPVDQIGIPGLKHLLSTKAFGVEQMLLLPLTLFLKMY